jgi:hypothetical protein
LTMNSLNALFLCHDEWSIYLDRRICQQARLLGEAGYRVSIACFTRGDKLSDNESPENISIARRLGFNGSIILTSYSQCASLPDEFFGIQAIKNRHNSLKQKLNLASYLAARSLSSAVKSRRLNAYSNKAGWKLSDPLTFDKPLLEAVLLEHESDSDFQLSDSALVVACDTTTARSGMALRSLFACSLWFDMHEYYSQQSVFPKQVRNRLYSIEKAMISVANKTFTVNPLLAKKIENDTGAHIDWLANYLDTTHLPRLKPRPKDPNQDITILFHGGAGPFRNIEVLVDALLNLDGKGINALFLQSGMSKKQIRQIAKSRSIEQTGYVSLSALSVCIANIDAIIIPYPAIDVNTICCSPNKLGDAIAFLRPILFNSQLQYLSHLSQSHTPLIPLDFSSSSTLSQSLLSAIPKIQRLQPSDFDALRNELGCESQKAKCRSWISGLANNH